MWTIADVRLFLIALMILLAAPVGQAQERVHDGIKVGHWVRVKGRLESQGVFIASEIEYVDADDDESLVGTPTDVKSDGTTFKILGLTAATTARTEWRDLTPSELDSVQVKVEGSYRGPAPFLARSISTRKSPGRDRIEGRVNSRKQVGENIELQVMGFAVILAPDVTVDSERPLDEWPILPAPTIDVLAQRDDDKSVLGTVRLGDTLSLGGRLEFKEDYDREFDLDKDRRRNKRGRSFTARGQIVWEPSDRFFMLLSAEQSHTHDHTASKTGEHDSDGKINEVFAYYRLPEHGIDIQVGRQDFDDQREWIYDENLDAVRVIYSRPNLRFELGAGTGLADVSRERRETDTYVAYLSNNDERQHLAAYVVDRRRNGENQRFDTDTPTQQALRAHRDKPIFFGVRALGEWFEEHEIWAELAMVRGYRGPTDYEGWGLDIGSTWSPKDLDPFYITLGLATTSGDRDPTDDKDTSSRQTGLQDNNGRFGGVTSFRYYGELFEPELSNMEIVTVGVGARLSRKTSLDLVFHNYSQVKAADVVRDSNLRTQPEGDHKDLGYEVDLILGVKDYEPWDFEVVVGAFQPGSAYKNNDTAWLGKFQARFRF